MGEYGELPTPTKSYTVTFNANGGNTPSPSSKTVSYIFNGWYTAETGGSRVESSTIMSVRGGNLYARWTTPTYGTMPSCTKNASNDYTYSLRGWYTASSGGTNITASTTAYLTSNQTLYAQWNSAARFATVTITYDNGIKRVTVNGTTVSSGWSGTLRQGNVIEAFGSKGSYYWFAMGSGDDVNGGKGKNARCTVPACSGSGTLYICYGMGGDIYQARRGGACGSWSFSAF